MERGTTPGQTRARVSSAFTTEISHFIQLALGEPNVSGSDTSVLGMVTACIKRVGLLKEPRSHESPLGSDYFTTY